MPDFLILAAFFVRDYWQVIAGGGFLGGSIWLWGLLGPSLLASAPRVAEVWGADLEPLDDAEMALLEPGEAETW